MDRYRYIWPTPCVKFTGFILHVQHIPDVPDNIKALYKTVWEISQKTLINMAADRGAYIDQSQSFNVHIAEPNFGKLTSMHFYAWKKVKEDAIFFLFTVFVRD